MLMTSAPTEKERIINKMDEYIKKNALYKIITQLEELARNRYLDTPSLYYPMYMTQLNERAYFKQIITDLPTADVAPVRHGRWETNSDRPDSLICSVCKCGFDMWKHDPHNFCPNCGAKMDKRDE